MAAQADGTQLITYGYDGAGNVVTVDVVSIITTPGPGFLTPSLIYVGQQVNVVTSGNNLAGVEITANDTALLISNVTTSETSAQFTLLPRIGISAGDYQIEFDNTFASVTRPITVERFTSITNPQLVVGTTESYAVEGFGLAGAMITSDSPLLAISGVVSSATSVQFQLSADPATPPGLYPLFLIIGGRGGERLELIIDVRPSGPQ